MEVRGYDSSTLPPNSPHLAVEAAVPRADTVPLVIVLSAGRRKHTGRMGGDLASTP